MKLSLRSAALSLAVLACLLSVGRPSHAVIEWTEKKQFKLDLSPLAMTTSPDGKWVIILTKGEVVVYSPADDKIIGRTLVDKSFDNLTYSPADDTVILSSSSGKTVKLIQLDLVHSFNLAGVPIKGPESAPVTIVVFSDYQ